MRRTKLALLLALALAAAATGRLDRRVVQAATGREPVIVIPGVAGSEFSAAAAFHLSVDDGHGGVYVRDYDAGERVWVNILQAALPGDDDYFDALKLQPDGRTPVAPALRVSDIYHSVYDDLIAFLQRQGYQPGVDLWLFPYDWRRDIRSSADDLDALVTRALVAANGGRADPATWTIRRADIVAHSMGGLVGRYYISSAARAARIDQLITLGSPQLGAVNFLKTLVYGDDFGSTVLGLGLNPDEARDVVQNMPGGMQLLPSRAYYTYYDDSDPSRLRPYVEDRDVDGDGRADGVLGYAGVRQLLLNLGKNRAVIQMAETYHDALDIPQQRVFLPLVRGGTPRMSVKNPNRKDRKEREGLAYVANERTFASFASFAVIRDRRSRSLVPLAANGVRWAALIGYGYATLGQIREYTGACPAPCPRRDELPVDGDGTVAVMSAAMGDPWRDDLIASGAQLWYLQRQHTDLVKADYTLGIRTGDGPALRWIGDILSGAIPTTATPAPAARLGGAWIAALGAVALHVQDAGGRSTGRDRNAVEAAPAAIPGSRYERLPEAEFAFVKRDQPYTIAVRAERAGSVDLKVRVLADGRVVRTALYEGVWLGARGQARLALPPEGRGVTTWPLLAVDADGDGVFEGTVAAQET